MLLTYELGIDGSQISEIPTEKMQSIAISLPSKSIIGSVKSDRFQNKVLLTSRLGVFSV